MLHGDKTENLPLNLSVLHDDEIILLPSNIVLGLFAQLSEKAKKKIRRIDVIYYKKYWPAPVIIIFKAKNLLKCSYIS